jgi:hypothetical protein
LKSPWFLVIVLSWLCLRIASSFITCCVNLLFKSLNIIIFAWSWKSLSVECWLNDYVDTMEVLYCYISILQITYFFLGRNLFCIEILLFDITNVWHWYMNLCILICLHNSSGPSDLLLTFTWNVFQERTSALAENKPLPGLCSSADIRPLKMEDFKYAHEQVCSLHFAV